MSADAKVRQPLVRLQASVLDRNLRAQSRGPTATDVGFRALADLPHPDPGGDWDPEAAEPNLRRKRSALTLTANLTAKGAGP